MRGTRLMLVAHNMSFDFLGIDGFVDLQRRGWSMTKPIIGDNLFMLTYTKNRCKIEVFDWLQIQPFSLKKLGERLGLPKGKIDFQTCSEHDLTVYCKRDVEISIKACMDWLDFLDRHDMGNFQKTVAAQAFGAYRHRFMPCKIGVHNHVGALRLESVGFKGGRVECFQIGELPTPIYYVDVNSMYLSVMESELFPYWFVRYVSKPRVLDLVGEMKEYLVMADVEIEISEPAIAIKKERLLFPTGRFRTVLTTPELEWVQEHGKILKCHAFSSYKGKRLFQKWAYYIYDTRYDYYEKNDQIGEQNIKKLGNSCFGKFGQRVRDSVILGDAGIHEVSSENCYDMDTGQHYVLRIYGGKIVKEMRGDEFSRNAFPAIAAHVSAYARMLLWKYIEIAGQDHVFYCDTDSLMLNKTGFSRLQPHIHDRKLGFCAHEMTGERVVLYGCKDYEFDGLVKIKGINKKWTETTPGVFSGSKIMKLKTMINNGLQSGIWVHPVRKVLKREYKKGVVGDDGRVTPFHLHEC